MTTRDDIVRKGAKAYVAFFETLTPDSLSDLAQVAAANIRFKDPFNDVRGIEGMRGVFEAMFRTVDGPVFRVSRVAFSDDACLLEWTFTGRSRLGELVIEGTSRLGFDDQGHVCEHIDYWDAGTAIYERLPVIGPIIRFIRKRL